jgi:chromatin remodeling complex protein RSC6
MQQENKNIISNSMFSENGEKLSKELDNAASSQIATSIAHQTIDNLDKKLKEMKLELPSTLTKIARKVSELEERLYQNKKEANDMYSDMKELEKLVERYVYQYEKRLIKDNEPKMRTPSGFASPTPVSDELCEFMGREKGTLLSRTETSKFLYKYIQENGLNDPIKKNIIVPDNKLSLLLGDISPTIPLTHFTIQKYISRHFYSQSKNSVSASNTTAESSVSAVY